MKFFEKEIQKYYRDSGRMDLPWRKKNISAYEVWVSEVFLQQTQVFRVVPYYEKFLKKYPDIQSLSLSRWEDFLKMYAGLGYYNRGRNMLETAKIVVKKYKGVFPDNKNELCALPGIGEYTASAILSFAYGHNTLAFDTNHKRVFGRFLHGSKNTVVNRSELEKKLHSPKKELNAGVMDFANDICTKNPKCNMCPLSSRCEYHKTQGIKEHSIKNKTSFPVKDADVYIVLHQDHKKYYSADADRYRPFFLNSRNNTREKIKKYFFKKYKLQVSVRPPHKKVYVKGKPIVYVNAQILLGKHEFAVFKKSDILQMP